MFAKRFFYVGAGLVCLTLACGLAIKWAAAAKPSSVALASVNQGYYIHAVLVGRTVYLANQDNVPGPLTSRRTLPPIPGSASILTVSAMDRSDVIVVAVLDNGDVYDYNQQQSAWSLAGNVLAP